MRVVDSLWFTNNRGTIGIVIIQEDVTGERKAYIGIGDGHNEKADTQSIVDWGNPLSISVLGWIWSQLSFSMLKTLSPRESRVISLRFGLEDGRRRTYDEVAQEFNVTRERIRQIEEKAIRKLFLPKAKARG